MAGIYIHIPFCRKACHYCDFHFSTQLAAKAEMVKAICREAEMQNLFLDSQAIDSVYFGGGTPSLLSADELFQIIEVLNKQFTIRPEAEITLEANPEDISNSSLKTFHEAGVNRLSIGIQSFNDEVLAFFNRAHNAIQAVNAIKSAQDFGYENLTADLIYGIPGFEESVLYSDLDTLFSLQIPHLSAYGLTIEPKTTFGKWAKAKKLIPADDAQYNTQFDYLILACKSHGLEQYEISNFALPDKHARHNSSYWFGASYLGLGPGAHSFDGKHRYSNLSNNPKYMASVLVNGQIPFEKEMLTPIQKGNEMILTRLRTKWGLELDSLKSVFPKAKHPILDLNIQKVIDLDWVLQINGFLFLTEAGKKLADRIALELMLED